MNIRIPKIAENNTQYINQLRALSNGKFHTLVTVLFAQEKETQTLLARVAGAGVFPDNFRAFTFLRREIPFSEIGFKPFTLWTANDFSWFKFKLEEINSRLT